MDINLAKYLLPEGLLDYFDIVSDKTENEKITFYKVILIFIDVSLIHLLFGGKSG
ncbi:MAG: hypothetical protein V3U92_09060 [Cellulophaga sp.]